MTDLKNADSTRRSSSGWASSDARQGNSISATGPRPLQCVEYRPRGRRHQGRPGHRQDQSGRHGGDGPPRQRRRFHCDRGDAAGLTHASRTRRTWTWPIRIAEPTAEPIKEVLAGKDAKGSRYWPSSVCWPSCLRFRPTRQRNPRRRRSPSIPIRCRKCRTSSSSRRNGPSCCACASMSTANRPMNAGKHFNRRCSNISIRMATASSTVWRQSRSRQPPW